VIWRLNVVFWKSREFSLPRLMQIVTDERINLSLNAVEVALFLQVYTYYSIQL